MGGSSPRSSALDAGPGARRRLWRGRRRHLARRKGWTVTAIDISEVASKPGAGGRRTGRRRVEWVGGDALQTPFPARLVRPGVDAVPGAAQGRRARPPCGALLDTVRPGGLLLAVYHDLDDEHREHMKSQGVDPADYVDADDLARLLGDEFTIELHAVEPRIDPPPDNPHIADVVLRARRRQRQLLRNVVTCRA